MEIKEFKIGDIVKYCNAPDGTRNHGSVTTDIAKAKILQIIKKTGYIKIKVLERTSIATYLPNSWNIESRFLCHYNTSKYSLWN